MSNARADHIAAAFEPLDLASLNARAALERRVDRKHVVDWSTLEALAESLAETHVVLEINGDRTFGYHTIYYDSDALDSFRAHVQGRRRRFKARAREYVESGRVRIEVKTKGARGETVKRWTSEADLEPFVRATLLGAYGRAPDVPLIPTLETRYRRITLASRASAERVTVDYELNFSTPAGSQAALDHGAVIVESKSELGRGIADTALRSLGVRPVSISKYIVGIGLTTGRVPNELRPLVRRYFSAAT